MKFIANRKAWAFSLYIHAFYGHIFAASLCTLMNMSPLPDMSAINTTGTDIIEFAERKHALCACMLFSQTLQAVHVLV